jgi:chemotaxis protein methyltransferase CheR
MHNFSEKISETIQSRLGIHISHEKIGFYLETLQKNSPLMKKLSREQYLEYLTDSSTIANEEWKILIKSLNITETYFFRDSGQIEILEKNLLPAIIEKNKQYRRLRIWSAGCSTGEEPYTISILLSEIIPNISEWDIRILATDINGDSINFATVGEYLEWSFRGVPEDRIQRHFTKKKNIYKINDSLKRNVQFIENNLLSTLYFNEFDLILCRNVFIYFDDHSKKIIIDKFEKALVDNGYLLIGHSEATHLIPNTFQSIQFQRSFVYQKSLPKIENTISYTSKSSVSTQEIKPTYIPKVSIEPIDFNRKWESETILKAREYADGGRVTEAESLVKEILKANSSNHEALFLQGQILEAHGQSIEAIETYKKVIYLNPLFLESYLTLSSLYSLLHNTSESLKVRKAGLSCLQNNENLKQVYKDKGYHIESLESFFSEESGIWL